MLTEESLRNIYKAEFKILLKENEYKNRDKITRGENGRFDYNNLMNFLEKECKSNSTFKNNLNDFLIKQFFFNKMNLHYIVNLTYFYDRYDYRNIKISEVKELFKELKLNNNLIDYKCIKNYDICNTTFNITTKEDGIQYLTNLRLLIFIEEIEKEKIPINLFTIIDIDLETGFISYKFNTRVFDHHPNKSEVISNLMNMFHDSKSPLSKLKVVQETHNLATTRKMIQNIFVNLSEQAEKLLEEKVRDDAHEILNEFFDKMGIQKNQEYINQVIAVIYQDISKSFDINDFEDGWAFRFVFREGDNTRASSIADNLEPIYNTKIYWNLKELMFKQNGTDFIEAGFLWIINNYDTVAVRLEQKNDFLLLTYYEKSFNLNNREEKEKIVLRNIRRGFQK